MGLPLLNLARMTTATVGTGPVTLGAAVPGYLTFDASAAQAGVVIDGKVVMYSIRDGANSEVGRGTYTAAGTSLARTVILASTNAGAAINLSGSAHVLITALAENFHWTHIETLNPAAAASIDSEGFSGRGFSALMFVIKQLTVTVDAGELSIRYKLNGTYKTAANYRYSLHNHSDGGTVNDLQSAAASSAILSGTGNFAIGADVLESLSAILHILNPSEITKPKHFVVQSRLIGQTGASVSAQGGGTYTGTDAAAVLEGVRFMCTQNMTGTIEVYGLKPI